MRQRSEWHLNHDDQEIVIDLNFYEVFRFTCWKLIPSLLISTFVWAGMAIFALKVADFLIVLFTGGGDLVKG